MSGPRNPLTFGMMGLFIIYLLIFLVDGAYGWKINAMSEQKKAVAFILERRVTLAGLCSMSAIYRHAAKELRRSQSSLRRWNNHYNLYGETPAETEAFYKTLKRRSKHTSFRRGCNFTPSHLKALRKILLKHPEYFLDEFVRDLYADTGVLFHPSTVWRVLTRRLGYSLKVYSEIASQRSEIRRHRYKMALSVLVSCPEQVLFIDESHKGRNEGRRRRAWFPRGAAAEIQRLHRDEPSYTFLGAANINGFVTAACDIVWRKKVTIEDSSEGASGTVDGDVFLKWIKLFVCPCLGRFLYDEPNSIVVMDNASTHMSEAVRHAIESEGAVLLYLPPYSPDLNPIEKMFSVYKRFLSRNKDELLPELGWEGLHYEAMQSVSSSTAVNEFISSRVPGTDEIETEEDILEAVAVLFAVEEDDE